MFGVIRTTFLILIAFVVGLFFERNQAAEACRVEGGDVTNGVCRGVPE